MQNQIFNNKNRMISINKTFLKIALLLGLLSCIYPPWQYTVDSVHGGRSVKPAGYYLIFLPPAPKSDSLWDGVRIDIFRLLIQWIIIILLLLVGSIFVISNKDNKTKSAPTVESNIDPPI